MHKKLNSTRINCICILYAIFKTQEDAVQLWGLSRSIPHLKVEGMYAQI